MEKIKKSFKDNKFKYLHQHGMINLNYLMDHLVSEIQDYFEYIIKKHEIVTDNPLMMIYVNKIENIITFKIKTWSYVELLTPETMKLLGSTEKRQLAIKIGKLHII